MPTGCCPLPGHALVKYLVSAVRQVEDFGKDSAGDLRYTARVSWGQPGFRTRTFSPILSTGSASSVMSTSARQAWPPWGHQGLLKLSSPPGSSPVSSTVTATWGSPQGCWVSYTLGLTSYGQQQVWGLSLLTYDQNTAPVNGTLQENSLCKCS